uniref:Large ribosomal subunit protein uL16m n=1 Tax=Anas platyrhynchos platyrhynchos TaxID=8840 RepID=A0A493TX41_ANAPP
MIRLTIGRCMDPKTMFAIWRVPAPRKAVTKKSLGHRMGGGKGPIDHYVTAVKSGRLVVEPPQPAGDAAGGGGEEAQQPEPLDLRARGGRQHAGHAQVPQPPRPGAEGALLGQALPEAQGVGSGNKTFFENVRRLLQLLEAHMWGWGTGRWLTCDPRQHPGAGRGRCLYSEGGARCGCGTSEEWRRGGMAAGELQARGEESTASSCRRAGLSPAAGGSGSRAGDLHSSGLRRDGVRGAWQAGPRAGAAGRIIRAGGGSHLLGGREQGRWLPPSQHCVPTRGGLPPPLSPAGSVRGLSGEDAPDAGGQDDGEDDAADHDHDLLLHGGGKKGLSGTGRGARGREGGPGARRGGGRRGRRSVSPSWPRSGTSRPSWCRPRRAPRSPRTGPCCSRCGRSWLPAGRGGSRKKEGGKHSAAPRMAGGTGCAPGGNRGAAPSPGTRAGVPARPRPVPRPTHVPGAPPAPPCRAWFSTSM